MCHIHFWVVWNRYYHTKSRIYLFFQVQLTMEGCSQCPICSKAGIVYRQSHCMTIIRINIHTAQSPLNTHLPHSLTSLAFPVLHRTFINLHINILVSRIPPIPFHCLCTNHSRVFNVPCTSTFTLTLVGLKERLFRPTTTRTPHH